MNGVLFALVVIYIIAVIMDSGIKVAIRKIFKWKYE
jgi:ABC-type nitrate/sulfonate/bicarbonate transport system permease component